MKTIIMLTLFIFTIVLAIFVALGVRNFLTSTQAAYILASDVTVAGKIVYKGAPHNHYFLLTENSYDFWISGESDQKLKSLEGKEVEILGLSTTREVKIDSQVLNYQELIVKSLRAR